MNETAILRAKVPARRLQRAEKILQKLGLTPTDAVNILLAQIEIRQGLPFEVSVQPKPLLTPDEQAAAWTESYGAYRASAWRSPAINTPRLP
jgi:addiction module RelB/DinJ family antitoxin